MIGTEGFRDVLETGCERRCDQHEPPPMALERREAFDARVAGRKREIGESWW